MKWKYVCADMENIKAMSYFLCHVSSYIILLLTRLHGSYNLDLSKKNSLPCLTRKKFIDLSEKREKIRTLLFLVI